MHIHIRISSVILWIITYSVEIVLCMFAKKKNPPKQRSNIYWRCSVITFPVGEGVHVYISAQYSKRNIHSQMPAEIDKQFISTNSSKWHMYLCRLNQKRQIILDLWHFVNSLTWHSDISGHWDHSGHYTLRTNLAVFDWQFNGMYSIWPRVKMTTVKSNYVLCWALCNRSSLYLIVFNYI